MRSWLRPYVTTGIAIAGASVIAAGPVLPVGAATVQAASTRNLNLAATVLTLSPSEAVDLESALMGSVCAGENDCVKVDYLPYWTAAGEFGYGVEALNDAINATEGDKIVYTHSSGGIVAAQWLEQYGADYDEETQGSLSFVLLGNPGRAYGGSNVAWGSTFPETSFDVIDVTRQYDPASDWPTEVFSAGYMWALSNAISSFFLTHLDYDNVSLDDSGNVTWTEVYDEGGSTEYVLIPSENLAMLEGLRWIGADSVADVLNDPFKELIETAYDRADLPEGADVGATSTDSFSNVISNLINAILSIPMAEINAINRFSAAMEDSGSWWVYTDVNVLGWDPANEEMTKGFVDMLIPFTALSESVGEATFLWLAANFPMDAGCSGTAPGQCDDPESLLGKMFTVGAWEFFDEDGYTFPEVINPVSENESYWGEELGETGEPTSWSEQTYQLDAYASLASVLDYLVSEPEEVEYPTLQEVVDTFTRLGAALWDSWYPFVPQSSLWNPEMSLSAYFLRPFADILCPDCNEYDPFMPVDWEPGDPLSGGYVPPDYADLYNEDGTPKETAEDAADGPAEEQAIEETDVVSDAIETLLAKFDSAPDDMADEVTDEEEGQTPVTETPVTEAPVTENPVTETPVTETPDTEELATETSDGETAEGESQSADPSDTKPRDKPEDEDADDGSDDESEDLASDNEINETATVSADSSSTDESTSDDDDRSDSSADASSTSNGDDD
ncbi:PE-PPE domain-containing protein [Mycolicibacterium hippocampi]|uniref:PE-PPE domain-containing protein n=1 Tax=Mycolicibacterium hippocampi TaxID=659824 RepID=UPI0035193C9D